MTRILKNGRSDWGHIDILVRRSADGGATWSAPLKMPLPEGPLRRNPAAVAQGLGKPGEITLNNPVAIVDHRTGAYSTTVLCRVRTLRCHDEHRRWPDVFQSGRHHGDLQEVSPRVWLECVGGWPRPRDPAQERTPRRSCLAVNRNGPSRASAFGDDDGGQTWQRGEIAAQETKPLINPNETSLVELLDGRVMLNIRSESKEHRRAISLSPDGATQWTTPVFHDELLEPICMASLCRLNEPAADGKTRLVFANPHNLDRAGGKGIPEVGRDRKNVTIKLSQDDGATWPVSRSLEPGKCGYSDLAVGSDGTIYCFYERGRSNGSTATNHLTVARFNVEWLTDTTGAAK